MTFSHPLSRGHLGRNLAVLATLVGGAVLLAGTAHTDDKVSDGPLNFTCDDGERFSLDFLPGHLRMRNGMGVFSLTESDTAKASANTLASHAATATTLPLTAASSEQATGRHYSDGWTLLWTDGSQVRIQRPDADSPLHCRIQEAHV